MIGSIAWAFDLTNKSSDAELIMDIEGEFQPRLDILPPPQR
jgi:hypothetical protein